MHNDRGGLGLYYANMASKSRTRPQIAVGWFLTEWMDTLKVNQAYMVQTAGWSKTLASHLYNRQQDYSPRLVKEAAMALKIAPWELLMHPEDAMALRRMRDASLTIAADNHASFAQAEVPTDRLEPKRKAG